MAYLAFTINYSFLDFPNCASRVSPRFSNTFRWPFTKSNSWLSSSNPISSFVQIKSQRSCKVSALSNLLTILVPFGTLNAQVITPSLSAGSCENFNRSSSRLFAILSLVFWSAMASTRATSLSSLSLCSIFDASLIIWWYCLSCSSRSKRSATSRAWAGSPRSGIGGCWYIFGSAIQGGGFAFYADSGALT